MNRHDSQRGYFAYELYQQMKDNPDIWLICLDLGYKVFDAHFQDFPDRCINPGAAEQAGMDIAIGLALSGKIPFVYSITPFLLYRPFESIRTYLNHENINVKLVGSGREQDYAHDGFSHYAGDDKEFMGHFPNILSMWPLDKEVIPSYVSHMVTVKQPCYINLKR